MSSNDIDYDNEIILTDDEQITNDEEPNPCGSLGKTGSRKKIMDMDFDELKEYTTKMMLNKKKYIRKYQKSDKGKAKIKVASKKFYDKNREKILEKKRIAYKMKKEAKLQ